MQNLWNDADAAQCKDDLALRVYTSRLLGADKSLVLHGGGNTSVKMTTRNIFGDAEDVLLVKGSGWDLGTIEAAGFAPVRMAHLLRLARLDALSDVQMVNEFRLALTNPAAPMPSVEAILHAALPHKFVDHTHADAIVTLTNTPNGEQLIRQIFGKRMIVIPYLMPGFVLAKYCAEAVAREATPDTIGMILMSHGIFTWGDTAKQSYDRMIKLVNEAEEYIRAHKSFSKNQPQAPETKSTLGDIAKLRGDISRAAGFAMVMHSNSSEPVMSYVRRDDIARIATQGPATPDHVIRTKRAPMIGRDVNGYVADYKRYFDLRGRDLQQADAPPLTMLDPAPRVVLDSEWGLLTLGRSAKDAAIAEEIYLHTINIVSDAEALGGWRALPASDIFDVEYWDLEQAKLKLGAKPAAFSGEVALVTGAASGIGKACVQSLLARGAAVVGLDLNPAIETLFKRPDFLGVACDVSDEAAISGALQKAVAQFGGLDMLVLNAGIFPSSKRVDALSLSEWQRTMRINLDANVVLMREAHALLKHAPNGGRIVIIGSKNVPAPGPGASAYSASKAALTQLARVAALEWGADHIRVNVVHPNAVFDTGIWTEDVLKSRAANYGMTVEQYKTNNVLHVEVTSKDVAELVSEMCGATFGKTTGAQVPIDGGNERVI